MTVWIKVVNVVDGIEFVHYIEEQELAGLGKM